MVLDLEPAPSKPIVDGEPAFGTYRGVLETTDLEARERGVGRLTTHLREKHWQWFAAADDSIAVGGAVVEAGLAGTVFCWVGDRRTGELLDVSRLRPSRSRGRRPARSLPRHPRPRNVLAVGDGHRL